MSVYLMVTTILQEALTEGLMSASLLKRVGPVGVPYISSAWCEKLSFLLFD